MSALASGRLTGSGAVFAGQSTNPFEDALKRGQLTAKKSAQQILDDFKKDAVNAGGTVLQNTVDAASPGAVIVTRNMLIGVAIVIALLVWKSSKK